MKPTAYLAIAMSDRSCIDIWRDTINAVCALTAAGIKCISPVWEEGVPFSDNKLWILSNEVLLERWKIDKELIRKADVVINISPLAKSIGVEHEDAFCRYCLWRPVIKVYPKGYKLPLIGIEEDDVIVTSFFEACKYINREWGTWRKRFKWRVKMLNRSLPKWIWDQIKAFF